MMGLTIIVGSCSKEELLPPLGSPSDPVDETAGLPDLGQILDVGTVTGAYKADVRQMETALFGQGLLLDGLTGEVKVEGLEMHFSFYTDQDDKVPTGTYNFSPESSKFPLTFDGGWIAYSTEDGTLFNTNISGGFVEVSYKGSFYEFSFNCTLENGDLLFGFAKGLVSYYDAWK